MPTVRQRSAARRDLVDHFVYSAENAGLEVAERFLIRAETSFNDLAGQPHMGAPLTLKHRPCLTLEGSSHRPISLRLTGQLNPLYID